MKLSSRARYAIRAMMAIAKGTKDHRPINLARVAKQTGISYRYLEQVSISLKNAGLLKAVSGKNGGHLLARSAEKIKVGEIVEAAIGPINVVECVLDADSCMLVDACECRSLYCLINQGIRDAFNSFTLADMAEHRVGKMIKKGKLPG